MRYEPAPDGVKTSRKLLGEFFLRAVVASELNREHGPRWPKKGERGVKFYGKKTRLRKHRAALRRSTLCSFGEAMRKEQA